MQASFRSSKNMKFWSILMAVSLFVQLFSYGTFRTNFSYNYFSYGLFVQVLFVQIQGGGGKSPRVRGGISSHKLLLRRRLFAPLASNFAPPPCICTKSTCTKSSYEKYLYEKCAVRKVPYEKCLYEKYLYEKSVRTIIVRKVILPKKWPNALNI